MPTDVPIAIYQGLANCFAGSQVERSDGALGSSEEQEMEMYLTFNRQDSNKVQMGACCESNSRRQCWVQI